MDFEDNYQSFFKFSAPEKGGFPDFTTPEEELNIMHEASETFTNSVIINKHYPVAACPGLYLYLNDVNTLKFANGENGNSHAATLTFLEDIFVRKADQFVIGSFEGSMHFWKLRPDAMVLIGSRDSGEFRQLFELTSVKHDYDYDIDDNVYDEAFDDILADIEVHDPLSLAAPPAAIEKVAVDHIDYPTKPPVAMAPEIYESERAFHKDFAYTHDISKYGSNDWDWPTNGENQPPTPVMPKSEHRSHEAYVKECIYLKKISMMAGAVREEIENDKRRGLEELMAKIKKEEDRQARKLSKKPGNAKKKRKK